MRMPQLPQRRSNQRRQHIPQRSNELTAAWFTNVLATGSAVSHVRLENIGADVGFMGEVHRCHLTWDSAHGDSDLPTSVIVKMPTQVDENFAVGDGMQAYEREIVVYQRLRPSLGLPMPKFFYGAMDPDPAPWLGRPLFFLFEHLPIRSVNWLIGQFLKLSAKSKRRYILVLEDIDDARAPTQLTGGTLDDAHQALVVLAAFHAHNWMRTEPQETYDKIWPMDRASRVFQASYLRNRDAFVERFGHVVSGDTVAHLDEIQDRVPDISASLAARPWTLLHGDFRLDNLLFRPDGEIVVLDLQGLGMGRPAVDVAYFITTALTSEHRDEEELLLRTYHDALVGAGVSSYSWVQLVSDCHLAKELLAHRIVGSADVLDTSVSGDSDDLLDVMQLRVLDWLT